MRSACFTLFSLCGAAGLRGTFPGHPRPPSLLLSPLMDDTTRIQQTQHPWEAHPAGIRTLPISQWRRKNVALPSTTLPSAPDTHTPWPGGGSFLGKNPPPSVRFEPTNAGTATSEHCLRQPRGHRATFLYRFYFTLY
jgi:hypothetical protein